MAMSPEAISAIEARYPEAMRGYLRLRLWVFGLAALLLVYGAALWVEFDVNRALERYDPNRLALATRDIYEHKIQSTLDLRKPEKDGLIVTMETSRRSRFDPYPEWVSTEGEGYRIDLGESGSLEITAGLVYLVNHDGAEAVVRTAWGEKIAPELVSGGEGWVDSDGRRVIVLFDGDARLRITTSKLEVSRYFPGWENFWFQFHHPLNGASFSEIWAGIWSSAPMADGQPADQSNIGYVVDGFLSNQEWQHGEVFAALGLTVLMALLGTMMASMLGLPLAFIAARNVNPIAPLRFMTKKTFDFLRAVDMLIWSLILIRGFGPGPLSGALAIFLTDTGTLGKLYSEAIENADRRPVEGVSAVGAGAVQRNWFGVIPQILPVFVSQGLYFLESNTRGATIIGILGAGGIGLKLADAMRTGQDWENAMYIILLIILVVFAMDSFSSWARRRLIHGRSPDLEAMIEKQRKRRGFTDKGVVPAA